MRNLISLAPRMKLGGVSAHRSGVGVQRCKHAATVRKRIRGTLGGRAQLNGAGISRARLFVSPKHDEPLVQLQRHPAPWPAGRHRSLASPAACRRHLPNSPAPTLIGFLVVAARPPLIRCPAEERCLALQPTASPRLAHHPPATPCLTATRRVGRVAESPDRSKRRVARRSK